MKLGKLRGKPKKSPAWRAKGKKLPVGALPAIARAAGLVTLLALAALGRLLG